MNNPTQTVFQHILRLTRQGLLVLLLTLVSCGPAVIPLTYWLDTTPEPAVPQAIVVSTSTPFIYKTIASSIATTRAAPQSIKRATAPVTQPAFDCGPKPSIAALVQQLDSQIWMQWVEQFSGARPIMLDGKEVTLTTRYTPAMFPQNGRPPLPEARAFDYLLQILRGWYPAEQIDEQTYTFTTQDDSQMRGKNLVLTIPGATIANEVVILSAHLDSKARGQPDRLAPGAEDNASGVATLLEAARLYHGQRFKRTIRIIWFTGEEQGLLGSSAYVKQLNQSEQRAIRGVINLDMFGYDTDSDRCFEMHVGVLPASDQVGRCFLQSAQAYQQGLNRIDYLTGTATDRSDHGSFWEVGVGAVEILENMFDNNLPDGCVNSDHNDSYHTSQDTAEKLNPDSAIRIVRSALAAAAAMAEPAGGN